MPLFVIVYCHSHGDYVLSGSCLFGASVVCAILVLLLKYVDCGEWCIMIAFVSSHMHAYGVRDRVAAIHRNLVLVQWSAYEPGR